MQNLYSNFTLSSHQTSNATLRVLPRTPRRGAFDIKTDTLQPKTNSFSFFPILTFSTRETQNKNSISLEYIFRSGCHKKGTSANVRPMVYKRSYLPYLSPFPLNLRPIIAICPPTSSSSFVFFFFRLLLLPFIPLSLFPWVAILVHPINTLLRLILVCSMHFHNSQ